MILRNLLLVFLLGATGFPVSAQQPVNQDSPGRVGSQIINDTTKNVYGPTTTRWTTEKEIFFDRVVYKSVDTTLNNYHRWTYIQRFNNLYKDLGNSGTALSPIFPVAPTLIGVSTGYSVYDQYFQTQELKYFDTKSPYTRMQLIWGGKGRAMTTVEFSRNITPRWNFGFNVHPILTDKQIERAGKGDRHVVSYYYDGYTRFATKDDHYSVLLNYRRIRHRVYENGGVEVIDADSTYASLFDPNVRPRLTQAISVEQRNQFHLFHEYRVGDIQIYHSSDLGKQYNLYREDLTADPRDYYDHYEEVGKDSVLVKDSVRFSNFVNEFGLKGRTGKVFYNGYYKIRTHRFEYKYLDEDTLAAPSTDLENYLGGRIEYNYDSLTSIQGWAELLNTGQHRIEGELRSRWLDVSVKRLLSKPGYVQNAYRGRFDYWNNNFKDVQTTQASAFLKLSTAPFSVSAGLNYTMLKNYIYFQRKTFEGTDQTVLPVQSEGIQQLVAPEFAMDLRFLTYLHFRPQIIYSKLLQNDDNALRVPDVFVNGQLAYEGHWFKKNLMVQTGFDVHWNSAYTPLGYDPAIQQFYVQDNVTAPSFLLADVFLSGKIKRGRFFFKYHNIVQAFTGQGYLPTPDYPGMKNVFDMGFELLLFD